MSSGSADLSHALPRKALFWQDTRDPADTALGDSLLAQVKLASCGSRRHGICTSSGDTTATRLQDYCCARSPHRIVLMHFLSTKPQLCCLQLSFGRLLVDDFTRMRRRLLCEFETANGRRHVELFQGIRLMTGPPWAALPRGRDVCIGVERSP